MEFTIIFFKKLKNKIISFFSVFSLKRLLKYRQNQRSLAYGIVYIQTFNLFPKNKLSDNEKISLYFVRKLFNLPTKLDKNTFKESDFDLLEENLSGNSELKSAIVRHHLITQRYFLNSQFPEYFTEEIKNSFDLARQTDPSAKTLSVESIKEINRETIKKQRKYLITARKLGAERLKEIKESYIKPIEITPSHIVFAISVFSCLFLVSGFLYTKIFFSAFGVALGDFFTVSDYLARSVDEILIVFLSTISGLFFLALGISDAVKSEIYDDQFETTKLKSGKLHLTFALIFLSILTILNYYLTGQVYSELFTLILIAFVFLIIEKFPWKHIKNVYQVFPALAAILIFTVYLGVKIFDDYNEVMTEGFKGKYTIEFTQEYESYSDFEYLYSASNYVFLIDKFKKVSVLPSNAVKSFSVRNDES